MLEDKTANNIQKRFYRTTFVDNDSQKEEMIVPEGKITITENGTDIDVAQYAKADVNVAPPTCTITVTNTAGAQVLVEVANIAPMGNVAGVTEVATTGAEITAFVTAEGGTFYPVDFETYAITAVTGNAELIKGSAIYTGDCGITIGLA